MGTRKPQHGRRKTIERKGTQTGAAGERGKQTTKRKEKKKKNKGGDKGN